MHPVILVILIVAVLIFISWVKRQPKKVRTKAWIYAGIVLVVLLVATGRLNPLMGAIVAGIAMLQRVMSAMQMFDTFKSLGGGGGRRAQASDITTDYLEMSLDHDSGVMDGRILKGRYVGKILSGLSLQELVELFNECVAADQQSAAVLDSYLNRRFGEDWRTSHSKPSSGDMSRDEAYEVLGLQPGASREHIIDAHRKLMQKIHPDRGGSTFLASQINRAKDLLLDG